MWALWRLSSIPQYWVCLLFIDPSASAVNRFDVAFFFSLCAGRPLSPATGFTAIALFNLLKSPLTMFPEIINLMVRSRIAIRRIKAFLDSGDVKGLPEGMAAAGARQMSSPFSSPLSGRKSVVPETKVRYDGKCWIVESI